MNIQPQSLPPQLEQAVCAPAPWRDLRVAVISDAAPARNGVGAYYQDLLEQLGDELGDVKAFSPTIEAGKWRAGLVLPLPGDTTQKMCLPNPWRLRRELRDFQPHVVIVATPGVYGLVGAFLARRLGVPVLAGFHTSFEQLTELYWHGSWRGRLVHWYFKVSHAYLFGKACRVLANSTAMLDLAERMGAPATALIGTPISAAFAGVPREHYEGGFSRVLFAGRLAAEKNIDAVLDAARALPDVQFSIAGDGPLRSHVERAAAGCDNLRYLGWLNRKALREQVDAHDALLLPSHFESFGTIALEVMARERLVIVSTGCGIVQWPELCAGLFIIEEDETAREAVERIAALPAAARRSVATRGLEEALGLNERCVSHWCELLLDTAREHGTVAAPAPPATPLKSTRQAGP